MKLKVTITGTLEREPDDVKTLKEQPAEEIAQLVIEESDELAATVEEVEEAEPS